MKKVKVLREMPFAKVGEEFEDCVNYLNHNTYHMIGGLTIHENRFQELFDDGWLEWVEEEKSLIEKWKDSCTTYGETTKWEVLFQIATEHFKAKFDEAVCPGEMLEVACKSGTISTSDLIIGIRKALFGEDSQ